MWVYISAIFLLCILFWIDKGRNNRVLGFFAGIILFAVVSGHNGQMANDYPHYMNFFTGNGFSMYGSLTDYLEGLEPGYYYYVRVLRFFFKEYYEYIVLWGLTICIPFLLLVKKNSSCIVLSVLMIFVINDGRNFMSFFCAHRQMLSIVLIMIAFYIYQNTHLKFKNYVAIFVCVLALTCHSTAYFAIPLLTLAFCIHIKNKKVYYLWAIVTLFISLFFNFEQRFYEIGTLLSSYFGDDLRALGDNYMDIDNTVELTLWRYIPFVALLCVYVRFYDDDVNIDNFFLKCFLLAVVMKNMFGFFPHIARSILVLVIFACIGAIPKVKEEKRLAFLLCVMAVLMFNIGLEIRTLAMQEARPEFYMLPYHFIWE